MTPASTLDRLATSLANSITRCRLGQQPVTHYPHHQRGRPTAAMDRTHERLGPIIRQLPGSAYRRQLGTNRLFAVCLHGGVPSLYVGSTETLTSLPRSPLAPPAGLAANIVSTAQINLVWKDTAGEETYTIELKMGVD